MRTQRENLYPLLTSVILHGLVFLGMVIYFNFAPTTFTLGNEKVKMVSAFVSADFVPQSIHSVAKEHSGQHKISQPVTEKKAVVISAQRKPAAKKMAVQQNKMRVGKATAELLAYLHAAIQKQQDYPQHAIAMQRAGRVTLKFTLLLDGNIQNLRMIKSSDTTSLDDAALEAVRKAVPFVKAKHYIKAAQEYSIDVVFELA